MSFGAFQAGYHRYLSEESVKDILVLAASSPYYQDVLAEHLKNGLFTYRIRPHSNKYLATLEFRHHDILKRLFRNQWSLSTIGPVISENMATLNNTVLHKPYEEFAGLLVSDEPPLSINRLREHTHHLGDWITHLRETYKDQHFQSRARKTTLSIALDVLRLIQARQENAALNTNTDPFECAGVTNRIDLTESLHNTMVSLVQQGVINYDLPSKSDWDKLLDRPNLAAACAPGPHVRPIPSLAVFENLVAQSGRGSPRQMLLSPDADTLIEALSSPDNTHSWGVFDNGYNDIQAFLIQSPIEVNRFSIYIASLNHDLLTYVGDLPPQDRLRWPGMFASMVDFGALTMEETTNQINKLA